MTPMSPGERAQGRSWRRDAATAGRRGGVSYLIVHELQGQGRLAHPSAANHDDLVEGQGALALALVCSHPAGFLRNAAGGPGRRAAKEEDRLRGGLVSTQRTSNENPPEKRNPDVPPERSFFRARGRDEAPQALPSHKPELSRPREGETKRGNGRAHPTPHHWRWGGGWSTGKPTRPQQSRMGRARHAATPRHLCHGSCSGPQHLCGLTPPQPPQHTHTALPGDQGGL